MFAVPGWAVSAEALKTQQDPSDHTSLTRSSAESLPKSSKKRKRKHGQSNGVNVTEENLAEMWKKHIEGGNQKRVRQEKRRRPSSEENVKRPAPEAEQDGDLKDSYHKERAGSARKPSAKGGSASLKVENAVPLTKNQKPLSDTAGHAAVQDDAKDLGKARYEERMRRKQDKAAMRAAGTSSKVSEVPDQGPNTTASNKPTNKKHAKPKAAPQPKQSDRDPEAKTPQKAPSEQASQTDSQVQIHPPNLQKPAPSTGPKSLPTPPPPPPPPQQPPPSNLTPLQKSMQAKLLSSRFRHLNQTLYTSPSSTALQLFTSTPSAYTAYHAGFRAQVAVWPQNPVETFISDIKQRGSIRRSGLKDQKQAWKAQKRKKHHQGEAPKEEEGGKKSTRNDDGQQAVAAAAEPLPRSTGGTCTIADLGCGDAQLAASLLHHHNTPQQQLNLKIHSFDFCPGDGPHAPLITVADITNLPLRENEIDLAICCLSLMGTNWVDVVDEAARVVRRGGEVWVAETKSRFGRPAPPPSAPALLKKDGGKGRKKATNNGNEEEEEQEEDERAIEIESDPEITINIDILGPSAAAALKKKRKKSLQQEQKETDLTPFLAIWRRRGFELKGEPDTQNRMFVRLRFVRSFDTAARSGAAGGMGKRKREFLEYDDEEGEDGGRRKEEEAKVLKPCVYKLR
ncbi:MAG: hypothetical protein Q9191_006009 [Dirinaria sp. TL-2023a]